MPKYLDEAGVRKLWDKTKEKASQAQNNAVTTAGNYTVNNKKISSNPTLSKSDVGLGNVTNDAQIPLSQKGVASGVATLGTDGKVPSSQLPSYVDDVLEFNGMSTFPKTGEAGKIYVDTSTNKTYRWSGTTYTEISASLALGETSGTAYAGDKGKTLATKVSALETTVGNIPNIIVTDVSSTPSLSADHISIGVSVYDRAANSNLSTSVEILAATSSAAGVMSAEDKKKLAGIAAGANAYSHPAGSAPSKAEGLYKISTDAQSHVKSVTAVKKEDITALGIPAKDTTYGVATMSANGLMSAADKKLLDSYNRSREEYLSTSGDLVYTGFEVHLGTVEHGPLDNTESIDVILRPATPTTAGLMKAHDKIKLDGIAEGAEVNQNAFSRVIVGSTNIDADNKTDSLTLVAGSNVTITPDATNDKITIAAKDTTYNVVTTSTNGLMSVADKELLDYYNANRGYYLEVSVSGDLVYGTDSVKLGHTFQGSMDAGDSIDVILLAATTEKAGVMSKADKTKLDGIVALTDAEIDAILV